MRSLLALVLVGLLATAALWWWTSPTTSPTPSSPGPSSAAEDPTPDADTTPRISDDAVGTPENPLPEALDERPAGEEGRRYVEMPDGRFLPALNGAVDSPKILWESGRPASPILEIRRMQDGFDWFIHADGTHSTTRMMWREDLQRDDATTMTQHPYEGDEPPEVIPPVQFGPTRIDPTRR